MKLLLIAPASGHWQKVGKQQFFNGKTFRFSLLSLLSVAAETPAEVEIQIVDEQIEEIPWNHHYDLVGVTCMTALAPRAYQIADSFRERKIPVVLGGMHPSVLPQEALEHADAVVAGEVEGIWQKVIQDTQAGKLNGVYQRETPCDLHHLKPLPRHLLNRQGYATVHAVHATRGCPHHCNFCSVSAVHGGIQRKRPVEEVLAEVATIPDRHFIFVDDNLTADHEYAHELFAGLVPLGKKWMTQSTLEIVEDPCLVDLAAQAGCRGFFVGLETFSDHNLGLSDKTFNQVSHYREAIAFLHSRGIGVEAGIVFGFDGDDVGVFRKTLDLLDQIHVDLIQVSIFTPLPGTPRFESMQDRLVDRDWEHYDFHQPVFKPLGMSPSDLQAGHDWVTHEFYRPWRIARRLAWRSTLPKGIETLPYAVAMNLAYYGRTLRWQIKGYDPAVHPNGPVSGHFQQGKSSSSWLPQSKGLFPHPINLSTSPKSTKLILR
jgi:radical SAM superfamily enzyme YgiQ (UPF0313 family)